MNRLPEWATHFKELAQHLGDAPNARPFGKSVHFLARSKNEYRILQRDELRCLYDIEVLLEISGIIVETWHGQPSPPQCHRCQAFGHASANCYLPLRCVRCGGEHCATDCDWTREQKPISVNCVGQHTAND
ncbi:Nucleic-acid-binding protein from transposon X-element [Eumeta japonica]|uniref:Nucleic-acid-binding protein from transposon X-element n=1 Tax=Eumeta variegata TaxID=151549 RepID=A0A4C1VG80_EUMVA|nr:Nucleic-acid-binding protein from transposon X-element [Eumeta japonica]